MTNLPRAPLPQIASIDEIVYGRRRAKPGAAKELRFEMLDDRAGPVAPGADDAKKR